ncbi:hypothetical protein ES703_43833 [subsurface metagenome]
MKATINAVAHPQFILLRLKVDVRCPGFYRLVNNEGECLSHWGVSGRIQLDLCRSLFAGQGDIGNLFLYLVIGFIVEVDSIQNLLGTGYLGLDA